MRHDALIALTDPSTRSCHEAAGPIIGDGAPAKPKRAEAASRLATQARLARQAIDDGKRARYAGDLVGFQRAFDRFMAAFHEWECACDDHTAKVP